MTLKESEKILKILKDKKVDLLWFRTTMKEKDLNVALSLYNHEVNKRYELTKDEYMTIYLWLSVKKVNKKVYNNLYEKTY